MTWVKLDDQFFHHPKAIAAGPLGRALFLASCCHASSGLTDGFVSRDALPMLLATSGAKRGDVTRLVNAGLWRDVPGGFEIHHYLELNPDAETVRARRDARARAGRIGGRRSKPPSKPEASASTFAQANGEAERKRNRTPSPYPVVSTSSSSSEPPHPQPVDDDNESGTPPTAIDPVDVTIRAVLERCADARMNGKQILNRPAYRAVVITELAVEHTDRLRTLIATHPTAPAQSLAGEILGEPNSLHTYRESA